MQKYKAYWFSQVFFPIGIVKTPSGRTYIGTGAGIDEDQDTEWIAQHGMPIDLNDVMKQLGVEKDEI